MSNDWTAQWRHDELFCVECEIYFNDSLQFSQHFNMHDLLYVTDISRINLKMSKYNFELN